MNNKIEKYHKELENNEVKLTALKERNRELEQKIREAETMEIFSLMRTNKISKDELVALLLSKKENQGLPSFLDRQAESVVDAPDHTIEHQTDDYRKPMSYDNASDRREDDIEEDEDEDY